MAKLDTLQRGCNNAAKLILSGEQTMRHGLAFAALIVLFVQLPVAFSQAPKAANNLQTEIERLHNQWFAAFDKGDGATMDRMEVPNLILINADGTGAIWQKPGPRAGK
jgi:hypothetical protein